MNTSFNRRHQDTPIHDAQGHWWSQPSNHAMAIGETTTTVPITPSMRDIASISVTKGKKKNHRGNRKLQRFRARLARRDFDVETITMLMREYEGQTHCENDPSSLFIDMEGDSRMIVNDQVILL